MRELLNYFDIKRSENVIFEIWWYDKIDYFFQYIPGVITLGLSFERKEPAGYYESIGSVKFTADALILYGPVIVVFTDTSGRYATGYIVSMSPRATYVYDIYSWRFSGEGLYVWDKGRPVEVDAEEFENKLKWVIENIDIVIHMW